MRNLRRALAAMALCWCTAAAGGCIFEPDPASTTCNRFDAFLENCYSSCWTGWDCVDYYDVLDLNTQYLLDDCADCLYGYRGTCAWCDAGGYDCEYLLTTYLGMTCSW